MDLLDKPLGSNRRERKPKTDKPAPTSKTNPKGEKTVAEKTGNPKAAAEPAAAAAAAALTPEQQKRYVFLFSVFFFRASEKIKDQANEKYCLGKL